jgi:hypothetical protein
MDRAEAIRSLRVTGWREVIEACIMREKKRCHEYPGVSAMRAKRF